MAGILSSLLLDKHNSIDSKCMPDQAFHPADPDLVNARSSAAPKWATWSLSVVPEWKHA